MKKNTVFLILIAASFCIGVLARPALKDTLLPREAAIVSPRVSQFEGLNGPVDLVLLGDSLTDHGRWSELLEIKVANRGIGRDTVPMISERLSAMPAAPVFIMAGINDLIEGRAISEITADYSEILEKLQDRRVVVQSVLGPDDLAVSELNHELEQLTNARGVAFLNLTEHLGHPLQYSYDGIHLTSEGYRIWASQIMEQYKEMSSLAEAQ